MGIMSKRMWTFLVGMLLFIVAVKADYCVIVLADSREVYNVSDLTLAAYIPLSAGDVVGMDIAGNDLPNMPLFFSNDSDVGDSCRNACKYTSGCQYYAYDICADNIAGACWLKYAMSNPTEHGCRAYGNVAASVPVDMGGGNYTMNLCHTTSCGSYTDCQLCQNVGSPASQYCTGNDAGAMYSQLNYLTENLGYDMSFYGDPYGCPGNAPRESLVHVVCNQPENKLVFLSEYSVCKYEYVVSLTGNCTFTPPTPSLMFSSQSSTSVQITILTDSHLYNLDSALDVRYTIRLDGVVIYTGSTTTFIYDRLPQEAVYSFTVQGTYNGRASPISQVFALSATSGTIPSDQVIEDMLTVLGQTVTQTGQALQSQIDHISSRLDVDVIQVLRHADDSTVDVQGKLVNINNVTLLNIQNAQTAVQQTVNNLDSRLSASTVTDIQQKLNNINSGTTTLQTSLTQVSQQLGNQTAVVQQSVNNIDSRLSATTVSNIQQKLTNIDTATSNLQPTFDKFSQQISNQTAAVSNLDSRLSADTVTNIQQKLSNIDGGTADLQSMITKLSQQLNNQTAVMQQLANQPAPSSGGVGAGGVTLALFIGVVIGIVGTVVGTKVYQRLTSGPRRSNATMSSMSLVDDE